MVEKLKKHSKSFSELEILMQFPYDPTTDNSSQAHWALAWRVTNETKI